jgi:RNAse (barnase) inhibitor barstar
MTHQAKGPAFYAGLLTQPDRAGAFSVRPADADALVQAASANGYLCVTLSLAGIRDKRSFLDAVAGALDFPPWSGRNWDALADCLGDMSWRPATGYVLVLDSADTFHAQAPSDFLTALQILAEAAREWAARDLPFWTFVATAAETRLIPALPGPPDSPGT